MQNSRRTASPAATTMLNTEASHCTQLTSPDRGCSLRTVDWHSEHGHRVWKAWRDFVLVAEQHHLPATTASTLGHPVGHPTTAAQGINPEIAPCVWLTGKDSRDRQGDQKTWSEFFLPADTHATCQWPLPLPWKGRRMLFSPNPQCCSYIFTLKFKKI